MVVRKHAEPSECSKVAKMMLCEALTKELVHLSDSRRSVRDNVFKELSQSDGDLRRHGGLRNCANDLGRLLIDRPEPGMPPPPLPANLREEPRDDFDLEALMAKEARSRKVQRLRERVPTPFQQNQAAASIESTMALDPGIPRIPADARYPSPAIGRQCTVPKPPTPARAASSRGGTSSGLLASQSVPALNLKPTTSQSRLAATIAKMKTTKDDPAAHLRRCAVQMGVPSQGLTTYMDAAAGPVSKAVDPKWSTELRKLDVTVGKKLKFETRLSGAGTALSPELRYIPKFYEDGYVPQALPKAL